MNILDIKPKYAMDGYCQLCEKDFDPNEEYPEYIIGMHTNSDDEWVFVSYHTNCYNRLAKFIWDPDESPKQKT